MLFLSFHLQQWDFNWFYEGYYARWAALHKLLVQFLKPEGHKDDNDCVKKQILSLGAGFDTTYFQLMVSFTFILLLLAKLSNIFASSHLLYFVILIVINSY